MTLSFAPERVDGPEMTGGVVSRAKAKNRATRIRTCHECGGVEEVRADNPAPRCRLCASRPALAKGRRSRSAQRNRETCQHCRRGFPASPSSKQRYCSRACLIAAKSVERTCTTCGGTFRIPRSILSGCSNSSGRFCSRPCSRGDYHWQHEPCWYAVRKTGKGHWTGDRKQTTLWQISSRDQDAATVHGTQKPVECMRRPILNNSSPGQAVYEPFMGSGTTLIAAETTGRVCLGVELNPAYVDVAVERWQRFTGQSATLDGSGERFDALKDQRTKPVANSIAPFR